MTFEFDYTREEIKEVLTERQNRIDKYLNDYAPEIAEMCEKWVKESYLYDHIHLDKNLLYNHVMKFIERSIGCDYELFECDDQHEYDTNEEENNFDEFT